ncbi:alanine racemase [Bradyrhizobium sp. U87765 SZCCT0131]|uniref:alanine racemase n=1 Tax=unclassified Bradyrhizobium TaxID=2631580 RepID=UPI001BA940CA|nr:MULTISPECIES: alanine racemase [unclassified Bradyrhizobium]MBR1222582.1 alanine racemase [Bradyrhizobium sp. U87765 SZCCT0131]MBR1265337.1 alanine racemase [Bradyrhizobium sp. U87765 SZCCT0134]MBR1302884.1 alanine racemase [Bradyrhizobium sp. U87765 SZCCT0110]MBR1323582.1 alanine racemase [Bradyrhizobium sp. U87765 SZCCT0109]MBR1346813.1 alanine racemase [Bradyrhizobium sp. U87765 SZCCT0048]
MTTVLATKIAREYGTPAVVIDMDRVERNIARIQAACDAAGVANRPHIKTHKSPYLAGLQRAAGAKGITCQKLGEAEVMVDGGLDDILISYNLLGEQKMQRLGALMRRAAVTVTTDNPVVLADLPTAATAAGRPVPVVIECDTGRKRAGVETPGEAIALARQMTAMTDHVTFAGFMLYPTESGWPEAQRFLDEALAGVRALGLEPSIVSTGGSPNLKNLGQLRGATEHRPGTYIYNDRMQVAAGVAGWEDCALTVYSAVVSRAAPERGILDAGSKTLTADTGGLDGYGLILEHPEARIARFAEEHGFLDLSRGNTRPQVGDVVRIVPNHVCVVVNMVDEVVMVRGDDIVGTLPVAARGRLR